MFFARLYIILLCSCKRVAGTMHMDGVPIKGDALISEIQKGSNVYRSVWNLAMRIMMLPAR